MSTEIPEFENILVGARLVGLTIKIVDPHKRLTEIDAGLKANSKHKGLKRMNCFCHFSMTFVDMMDTF